MKSDNYSTINNFLNGLWFLGMKCSFEFSIFWSKKYFIILKSILFDYFISVISTGIAYMNISHYCIIYGIFWHILGTSLCLSFREEIIFKSKIPHFLIKTTQCFFFVQVKCVYYTMNKIQAIYHVWSDKLNQKFEKDIWKFTLYVH